MTYNIGGGRKDSGSAFDSVIKVIQEVSPDILVLQEAAEWLDAEQRLYSVTLAAAEALGYRAADCYFGPTLSLKEHFH
ncbi:MAG TPA: endonuclease/exonuclease/phosphatase family protein [Anaerolineae bacterium]